MGESTTTTSQIKEFYDGHAVNVQEKVGVNIRHRSILSKLLRAGLKEHHRVLEVGCGVGTLTELIVRKLKSGALVATDISEQAISLAREKHGNKRNISFKVTDMSDFVTEGRFDVVVLPDVLEHIPEEQHAALFALIEKLLAENGVVCIHIPDPFSLQWMREHRPEALQIVDQSLSIADMVERFGKVKLLLDRYERYGLWTKEPDYNWIEFRRPPARIEQTTLNKPQAILNEIKWRSR